LAEERERMDEIKARATPVAGCGPAIPVAPARGAQAAFMPRAMVPDGTVDGFKVADAGWRGFRAVRCLDVFDRMAVSARRRKQSFGLTHGQVAMGVGIARSSRIWRATGPVCPALMHHGVLVTAATGWIAGCRYLM